MPEHVVRPADFAQLVIFRVTHHADVLLEDFDCCLNAIRCRVGFAQVEIERRLLGPQPDGVKKSYLRGGKVPQVDVRNPQKFLYLIFIRMELKLFFEFFARLGVTFFLIVLKVGVSEKAVSAGILRI